MSNPNDQSKQSQTGLSGVRAELAGQRRDFTAMFADMTEMKKIMRDGFSSTTRKLDDMETRLVQQVDADTSSPVLVGVVVLVSSCVFLVWAILL